MARYAKMENGLVVNVINADQDFVNSQDGDFIEVQEEIECCIGFIYENNEFSDPNEEEV